MNLYWAWEMAQLIKHLRHKCGNWSSDLQVNARQICQVPVIPAAGKQMGTA